MMRVYLKIHIQGDYETIACCDEPLLNQEFTEGDFRIDGTLEGTIVTNGRVVVGNTGFIKGKVECTNADVEGKFSGELLVANTLTVKSSANISGDVVIGKLSVEPGAAFNATCAMKGAVKELNKNEQGLKEKTA